jgi:hypothetical protein
MNPTDQSLILPNRVRGLDAVKVVVDERLP